MPPASLMQPPLPLELFVLKDTAALDDAAPANITLSELIEEVVENYGRSRQNALQLQYLQEWIAAQLAENK